MRDKKTELFSGFQQRRQDNAICLSVSGRLSSYIFSLPFSGSEGFGIHLKQTLQIAVYVNLDMPSMYLIMSASYSTAVLQVRTGSPADQQRPGPIDIPADIRLCSAVYQINAITEKPSHPSPKASLSAMILFKGIPMELIARIPYELPALAPAPLSVVADGVAFDSPPGSADSFDAHGFSSPSRTVLSHKTVFMAPGFSIRRIAVKETAGRRIREGWARDALAQVTSIRMYNFYFYRKVNIKNITRPVNNKRKGEILLNVLTCIHLKVACRFCPYCSPC